MEYYTFQHFSALCFSHKTRHVPCLGPSLHQSCAKNWRSTSTMHLLSSQATQNHLLTTLLTPFVPHKTHPSQTPPFNSELITLTFWTVFRYFSSFSVSSLFILSLLTSIEVLRHCLGVWLISRFSSSFFCTYNCNHCSCFSLSYNQIMRYIHSLFSFSYVNHLVNNYY